MDTTLTGALAISCTVTVSERRELLSTETVTRAAIAPPARAATRATTPTAGVIRRARCGFSGVGA